MLTIFVFAGNFLDEKIKELEADRKEEIGSRRFWARRQLDRAIKSKKEERRTVEHDEVRV